MYRLLPAIGSGGRRGRGCREGAGEGLVHLKGLTNLQSLTLMGRFDNSSQITDAGLAHLKGLANLKKCNLLGTKITAAGVADLQKALPNCKISK